MATTESHAASPALSRADKAVPSAPHGTSPSSTPTRKIPPLSPSRMAQQHPLTKLPGSPMNNPYSSAGPRPTSLSPTHLSRHRRGVAAAPPGSLLVPTPNTPFLGSPSMASETPVRFSEHQKCVEYAVAAERKRAKEMEAQEKDLSADELRKILKQERHRMAGMARTIADLKSTAVECQSAAEIHEEGRINSLLGRLETMQMEKGRIVNELEREEEMLTNTLQKKLDQVKREKRELEKQIEHEQKSHTNLKSTLTGLRGASDVATAVEGIHTGTSLSALDEQEDEDDEDTDLDAVLPDLAAMHHEGV